jgi:hypothetical protein
MNGKRFAWQVKACTLVYFMVLPSLILNSKVAVVHFVVGDINSNKPKD